MELTKIVITGGPCAGKTTALSWIQNAFAQKGIKVLFIPETATELISGGVAPWTCGSNLDYQKCQMRLQMEKEAIFEQAAKSMPQERVLLVCDRGALDNKAYMTNEEFQLILDQMGLNEIELRDSYDAVFHLITAANGSEEFYTTANNQARIESIQEAIQLDEKLLSSWNGHPHLRIIDNSTGFQEKMKRLLEEINAFLGESQAPYKNKKLLVKLPDLQALLKNTNWGRLEITQTYLKVAQGVDSHIRRRGADDHFIYYQKTKRKTESGKLLQVERRLTPEEYTQLLEYADPHFRPLVKTQYYFTYGANQLKLDIYPFWKDTALLTVGRLNHKEVVQIPDSLEVIQDVTNDPSFTNLSLAKIQNKVSF